MRAGKNRPMTDDVTSCSGTISSTISATSPVTRERSPGRSRRASRFSEITSNYFARSDYLADQTPPAYRGPPRYEDNTLAEVSAVQRPESQEPPLPYEEGLNHTVTAPQGYDTYERKRWTGTEFALGAIPLQ
jgi:hypothetical protein